MLPNAGAEVTEKRSPDLKVDWSILRATVRGRTERMERFTAMETFISVIETGSSSAGACRMKVRQPAVSKAIAQLESKLGVRLFVRSTRNLTPTEAVQRFYDRPKAAIVAAEDAEAQARGTGTSL